MSKIKNQEKFNFFVPAVFEKAGETGELKISGVCSSKTEDADGETLDPSGFDFQPLLDSGYFNWNHQARTQPGAILGRPTTGKIINKGQDFYIEGFLYKGLKQAREVYELAQTLQKEDPDRRLGFSIEGHAVERDPINPKRVRKAVITGVAITHCPKNPNTLLNIIKGDYQTPFVEDEEKKDKEELEKTMGTAQVPAHESVEGTPHKDWKVVEKSCIYDQIFTKFTTDIAKANQIYDFIKTVNQKYNPMAEVKQEITQDTLTKAFELLDLSIAKSTDAGQEEGAQAAGQEGTPGAEAAGAEPVVTPTPAPEGSGEPIQKSNDAPSDEDLEKACKDMLEKGMSSEDTVAELEKAGYDVVKAQDCVTRLTTEAKPTVSPDIQKSLDVIQTSLTANDELVKGLVSDIGNLTQQLDGKFTALGTILKVSIEKSQANESNLDTLTKSFDALNEKLESIGKTPYPTKSATNIRQVDRFQKGGNEGSQLGNQRVYVLSNAKDRTDLSNAIFAKAEVLRKGGNEDTDLEKAVMDLEISKSLDSRILPKLNELGFLITAGE